MNKYIQAGKAGFSAENPLLVLVLGMGTALAVTTTVEAAVGMGAVVTATLAVSSVMISLLRGMIPYGVRLPCYMALIAGLIAAADLLHQAYFPEYAVTFGVYIPLMTVNCIVLARAEMFASANKVLLSLADGVAMGLGFSAALIAVASLRELLGGGSLWGYTLLPGYQPALIMLLPPGGLLALGFVAALWQRVRRRS